MKTKNFIKILKNKEYTLENVALLKQEVSKYPYFTPLLVAYLEALKVNDDIEFKKELIKYSVFITNRHSFIKKILEIDYLKANNKLDSLKTIDQEELQQELYEKAKRHHEQIIDEIIEPKIEKLKKLSELSKKQEQQVTKTKLDTKTQEQKATTENNQAKTKKVPEIIIDIEAQTSTEQKTTVPPPTNNDKQETTTKKESTSIDLDDIFKKIEELKKQKLQAVDEHKKRVNNIDKLIDKKNIRENIEPPSKTEPAKSGDKKEQPKEEKAEATSKTAKPEIEITPEPAKSSDKKEQPKEEKTEATSKTAKPEIEITPEPAKSGDKKEQPKEEKNEADKGVSTPQNNTENKPKTAADRILEEIARRREMRKKKQIELIDKFLEEQPSIDRTKKPSVEGDLSEPHTKEIEVVTEKMAMIYELQGLYDKAIETYEKLILQKPEKKDYFAKKIQELKQKLNS